MGNKYENIRYVRRKVISNLIICTLVMSVGALCLAPLDDALVTEMESSKLYSSAKEDGVGISLMFNVYWGTEEVYRILDTLETYQAKATFFIGGCWADDNVDCLRAIYEKGHEIGNHGYFHKEHDRLDLPNNQKEIASCNRFIELSLGEAPKLFAPPSGAYNEDTLKAAGLLGMQTILWSKDTIDWRDKNAALIYSRATQGVTVGEFILMHPMKETADALEDILKYYKAQNWAVVTVSENLKKEG
ncbi:MAG: polysaccharide deacetylase family protein [Clostridia bacterium]|nr:polysaccharide deacetylase family protein [Clostridia bacterium]